MREITRRTMLYPTKVEYGDYSMNHVLGCSHGCIYPCYAYLQKKRFRQVESFEDWMEPRIVSNTLDLLKKEIPKLKGKIRHVNMCFSTDPFMHGYPEVTEMTLKAAELLNDNGIKCVFLTKGVLPVERLKLLSPDNECGITLVSLDEDYRKAWEPGAASVYERLNAFKQAQDSGLRTWASLEPYPTPNMIKQDIIPLLNALGHVKRLVFGRINYCEGAYFGSADKHEGYYTEMVRLVRSACEFYGAECVIKAGTPGCEKEMENGSEQ